MLRSGYHTLQSVRTKVYDFGGFQIKVQFNPGRLISTSAKVDATSIKERKCFLCRKNLPLAQRGILCDGGRPQIIRKLESFANYYDSDLCQNEFCFRKFYVIVILRTERKANFLLQDLAERKLTIRSE